jgi:hypothetical protein
MRREWSELPRDDTRPQWAGFYVTMNRKGEIVMNRATYERLGSPAAFKVLFDRVNNCIGLTPTSSQMRNAYPAYKAGRHGGRRISAFRLLQEHRLRINETLEFADAEIDEDGILVLDLRTARISNRALNHPTRRAAQ